MHAHIAIFAPARIASPLWVHGDGVQRAEMSLDSPDFILKNAVVKSSFEFALSGGRGGDVHGGLATAEDDEGFLRGYSGGVDGRVGDIGFQELEGPRRYYLKNTLEGTGGRGWRNLWGGDLGGFVFGGGYEVSPI